MKKKYIIFLVILAVVYIGAMFLLNRATLLQNHKEKNSSYLILGYDTFLRFFDGSIETIEDVNKVTANRYFDVYMNNEYQGLYTMKLVSDTWHFYDSSSKEVRLTGNLLATAGNQKITPVSFSIDSLNETELQQLQGIDYSTLTINEKVVLDFDQDGVEEELWNISNLYNDTLDYSDKIYAIIAYVDNGTIQFLHQFENTKNSEQQTGYLYRISNIIRIGQSEFYDIIIKRSRPFGNAGDCHLLYSYVDGKYELKHGC